MRIFNTVTKKKEPFVPLNDKRVTMYVCGPTVYNNAHIGNARPAVVFDVLFRVLRNLYGQDHVVYARNITDIDDKIILKATQEGVQADEIATRYTDIYLRDMASLGVLAPSIQPKATDHIPAMVEMIHRIIHNGHAYVSEGHVLFDVGSYSDHGVFSKGTDEVSRLENASYKKDQRDFVLWKPAKEGEPSWESPWGLGRPGWHIECSAMIEKNLGLPIDIHGGGIDLSFPHHENEISQGVCSQGHCGHNHGHEYSRYWMHNEFVNLGDEKIAKSTGNVILVSELLNYADGEAIRLALLTGHYRSALSWSTELLDQATNRLDGWYGVLRRTKDIDISNVKAEVDKTFLSYLYDDLNLPLALVVLSSLADRVETSPDKAQAKADLVKTANFLGLLQHSPDSWFKGNVNAATAKMVDDLIIKRNEFRANKQWAEADEVRKELSSMGVSLLDTKDGTEWSLI